jgi:hypothetical protein
LRGDLAAALGLILVCKVSMSAQIRTGNSAAPSAARGRFAHQQLAIGAHFIGFGIDFHLRRGTVVDHVGLAQRAHVARHDQGFIQPQLSPMPAS